jgi:hypothetical protein
MAKGTLKVYAHGDVGKGHEIEKMFEKIGVNNPFEYKFGDPWFIYYVNKNNEVALAEPESDVYYVITNSNDWVEMKPKQTKKSHKFLITVKEGSNSCNGCALLNKCNDTQKSKCQIAISLSKLTDYETLTGKVLEIKELDD